MADPRYQHQSWLVRRWRDRHLLVVPFDAIRTWWTDIRNPRPGWDTMSFANHWSMARGMADVRRNYVYRAGEYEKLYPSKHSRR